MKNTAIALGYAFCWGVGLTLAKIALQEISPTTLLIVQLLSSVLFLLTACYLKQGKFLLSVKVLKQGMAGIFEPALAYMFGTLGLQLTTATNASLIGSTEVVLTVLMAAIFLNERLTVTKLILAIASFSGVLFLVGQDTPVTSDNSSIGDLLIAIGVLFAVGYVLISKRQIAIASPLELTASQQLVGLIAIVFGFGILSFFNRNYEINAIGISPQFWLLAIVSGIMQYALAFLLYLTSLGNVPVSQAAFYVALIPVFGVASAILLIGEQPSALQWIGAGLVVGASYLASKQRLE